MTLVEANYRAQFTALDTLLGSMSATSTYLQQQLASSGFVTASIDLDELSGAMGVSAKVDDLISSGIRLRNAVTIADGPPLL